VLASPMLSNEALYLLTKVIGQTNGEGVFTVRRGSEAPLEGVPDLALRAERAANVRGAELLGYTESQAPWDPVKAGDVLVVADEELAGANADAVAAAARRAGAVIVIGTVLPSWAGGAAVVLPIANMAEEEGTFTNLRGRVQRYLQAKAPPALARPGWAVLAELLAALGEPGDAMTPAAVFETLAGTHAAFAGMSYDTLGLRGEIVPAEVGA
jgi:NADH-quinone oxidoreductase subunit G